MQFLEALRLRDLRYCPIVSLDFETQSELPIQDSTYLYATHPSTKLMCAVFGWHDQNGCACFLRWTPGEQLPQWLVDYIANGGMLSSFNATFERLIWENVAVRLYGWPKTQLTQWYCTAAACATLATPKRLEHVAEFLKLNQLKDPIGGKLMKKYCSPNRQGKMLWPEPEELTQIVNYCEQDVRLELLLQQVTRPMQPSEYRVWLLDQEINDRGIYCDLELARAALKVWEVHEQAENERFKSLTGFNATQVGELLAFLNQYLPEPIVSVDKSTLTGILEKLPPCALREVIELRLDINSSAVKKFPAFIQYSASDSRVRGCNRYHGASTGRWAGRLLQPQNFFKGIFKEDSDIALARQLAIQQDIDGIKAIWGSVSQVLGSLCRPTIRAAPGHRFLVADFSQIECRIVAWLAGQQSLVELFGNKQDPYIDMARKVYPTREVLNPSRERDLGKAAVLGCGFQMGPPKFKDTCKRMYNLEIDLALAKQCVYTFRDANPYITAYWKLINDAAVATVNSGISHAAGAVSFKLEDPWLYAVLPNGRELAYYEPRTDIDPNYGTSRLSYLGVDGQSDTAYREQTYGGKLTENCLSRGSLVLTDRGWVPIETVEPTDLIHDGVEFVSHEGLIDQGYRACIRVDGIWMTPDHKVLSNDGWKTALESKGLEGPKVWALDLHRLLAFERLQSFLGVQMRLRTKNDQGRGGCDKECQTRLSPKLRLSELDRSSREASNAQHDVPSSLCGLSLNVSKVQESKASSVEELRCERNYGVQAMVQVRKFLGRHGANLSTGIRVRPHQQQSRVLRAQLSMDQQTSKLPEQKKIYRCTSTIRGNGNQQVNNLLPYSTRMDRGSTNDQASQQVYDIKNCGPRQRFVVLGSRGPIVVHNCVQAIARDIMVDTIFTLEERGYKTVFSVHDEVIFEMPNGQGSLAEVEEVMRTPVTWAPGIPVDAKGFETEFYKKG